MSGSKSPSGSQIDTFPNVTSVDHPARARKCTKGGLELFQEQCSKNRDQAHKKIISTIQKIDQGLSCNNNDDNVSALLKTLNEIHEEYNRSHLRCLELCEDDLVKSDEEKKAYDVLKAVQNVQFEAADYLRKVADHGQLILFVQTRLCHSLISF